MYYFHLCLPCDCRYCVTIFLSFLWVILIFGCKNKKTIALTLVVSDTLAFVTWALAPPGCHAFIDQIAKLLHEHCNFEMSHLHLICILILIKMGCSDSHLSSGCHDHNVVIFHCWKIYDVRVPTSTQNFVFVVVYYDWSHDVYLSKTNINTYYCFHKHGSGGIWCASCCYGFGSDFTERQWEQKTNCQTVVCQSKVSSTSSKKETTHIRLWVSL